jgi:hypothetical protein
MRLENEKVRMSQSSQAEIKANVIKSNHIIPLPRTQQGQGRKNESKHGLTGQNELLIVVEFHFHPGHV